jgi:hypothetical protein
MAARPLGQRLQYVLRHLRTHGRELTDPDIEANFVTEDIEVARFRENLSVAGEALGDFELRSAHSPDGQVVIAVVERDGRTWRVGVRIEKRSPHRVRNVVRSEVKPELKVRLATADDAAALRAIEFKAPIVLGETRVVYDRGEDYFAAERLMGDVETHIVERDEEPVALSSLVINKIRVNGSDFTGIYSHRLRVLPEARGGMAQLLNFASFEFMSWRADVPYSFVAAGNDAVRRNSSRVRQRGLWSVHPERVVIDTAQHAGPASGRPATREDDNRIVSLLNGTHGQEELYVAYTPETLAARLQRQPDLYSWGHLRLGARAVVGVWPAHLNVIRETGGDTLKDDRALVLDYGYEAGAEEELISLIRAECADLARNGTTELTIFTSQPAGGYSQLTALAKRIEPYVLGLYLPAPDDLARRGVYVDQLYF